MSSLSNGRLVSILNQEPIPQPPEILADNPDAKPINVDGKKGQILAWIEHDAKYLVQTFDGDVVGVAGDRLEEFQPAAPEDRPGGFDLAFPGSEEGQEVFPGEVAAFMLNKHYCVVQMSSMPEYRHAASDAANGAGQAPGLWIHLTPEFESVYIGRSPGGKKVMWIDDDILVDGDKEGLAIVNEVLATVGSSLMPACRSLGFDGHSQTNGLVHVGAAPDEDLYLRHLVSGENAVVDSKTIRDHLGFMQRRKICIMYFVSGSGGSLALHHREGEAEDISMTCVENQVLIFRHDLLDYTYTPKDSQFAVQTWILREPFGGESDFSEIPSAKVMAEYEKIPEGPRYGESSETVDCIALGSRIPGSCWKADDYWSLLSTACDGIVVVPITRWDIDMYYTADQFPGKGYIKHFGFLTQDQMAGFDHEFFGISMEDAARTDPPQRCSMEVGYDALHRGGFDRAKLRGLEVCISFGYAESEFCQMAYRGVFGPLSPTLRLGLQASACASRLHWIFGMTGPCSTVETACSSSLTATSLMHCHMRPSMSETNAMGSRKQVKYGLALGSNGHFDPFYTISLCAASMLTHNGRCFTFDQSADGFVRGEGTAAMHYRISGEEDVARLAVLAGTSMNQDGRSASLTAPHGPSQQECIRQSLREAAILPLDIQIQELHGTGTALGDPIEIGALRATMMTYQGRTRAHPLVKTSSKSNLGHTEMCAGINGIMKCVLMGCYCSSAPNCHMRLLNPHIDSANYPVYFSSEFVDQGSPVGFHGVSSFGFGGSNARGDIWCRCLAGPRNTQPGDAPVDFSERRLAACAELYGAKSLPAPGEAAPEALEVQDLEGYTGSYLTGDPMDPASTFYLRGTFNGWGTPERMFWLEDRRAHCFAFALGEAAVEQFQILCNRYDDAVVFPASKWADMDALVLGPGAAPPGHTWVIDGLDLQAATGTVFLVCFSWDAEAKQKRVLWEECTDERGLGLAATLRFEHSYHILASWGGWSPQRLEPVPGEPGCWQTTVRIGNTGQEQFHFQRDRDARQSIYPARRNAARGLAAVRGPDIRRAGMNWLLSGRTGEKVTVRLQVRAGAITVTTASDAHGVTTFRSRQGEDRRQYFLTGSFNDWGFQAMVRQGARRHRAEVRVREGAEWFQVVVDEDTSQAVHPEMREAEQLASRACGPDSQGEGLYWAIYEEPGAVVEVTLDFAEKDRRDTVKWEVVGSRPGGGQRSLAE